VRGIVRPKPILWATFIVLYTFGIESFIILAVIGNGMVSLGKTGIMLYISPLFLILLIVTYIADHIGKNKAANQTQ
jgi:hypothetical protein|tara:strand:+ start:11154 stop:11381 length:228 start_codon:yes stop_codon:yes gene_type:complete